MYEDITNAILTAIVIYSMFLSVQGVNQLWVLREQKHGYRNPRPVTG
jgi:hypothetical protein